MFAHEKQYSALSTILFLFLLIGNF